MFVGRREELARIRERLEDRSKAQLLILYGRRRIGKTRLIREALRTEQKVLFFEGIEGERTSVQLDQFLSDLAEQTGRVRLSATHWREAFRGLGEVVEKGRWVVVLDELPWMGAGRTAIVSDLKLYWDRWTKNRHLVLILCGSVASFMTNHVVHSKALHNRKTLEMNLGPLPPHEAGGFIAERGSREKAQLYMCLGGVPKYLEQIDARSSVERNLNRLAFTRHGFFVEEFETLFKEQFKRPRTYESVVRALAAAPAGVSELSRRIGAGRGGGFQDQLENLVRAQFVRAYRPIALQGRRRTRTLRYKLVDPFVSFYFRYVHDHRDIIAQNVRENLFRSIAGPTIQQYYSYSWERLFEDALSRVFERLALPLADIRRMGPYFQQSRGRGSGLQIDWLVVRRDDVWVVFELKYTASPVGSEVVAEVDQKVQRLGVPRGVTVERVLVSAAGAKPSLRRSGAFSAILDLDDLVG